MTVNSINNQKTIEQIIKESAENTGNRKIGQLGKDDFLNLLVTQLRYQDPLEPVDDKEFISQMAQFSSLEQMQNMNGSLSQSQAYSLLGKHVAASMVDENTKEVSLIAGDVMGIKVAQGKTYVVVKGRDVPVDRITEVVEGIRASQSNILGYSGIVGRRADGSVYDPGTGAMITVSGVIGSIKRGMYEDYAVMDGVYAAISGIPNTEQTSDPDFRVDYLTNKKGQMVDVEITDSNGAFITVRALLQDFTVAQDGTINAILDQVDVPIESITNLNKVSKSGIASYTNLIGYNVTGSIHDARFANYIPVSGIVRSVEAGQYEDYVIIDGAAVEVVDVITDKADADLEYKKTYLSQNQGKEVTLLIKDKISAKRLTVTATLESTAFGDSGNISAVLNNLKVPADSISDIRP